MPFSLPPHARLVKLIISLALVSVLAMPQLLAFPYSGEPPSGGIAEVFFVPKAHAAPANPSAAQFGGGIQQFMAGFLEVIVIINWVSLAAIQTLLSPDAIFGQEIVDPSNVFTNTRVIEVLLRNLWITSRNIVNTVFAFILLFAGIWMIVRAGEEGMSAIKQRLPKFVLAVILVNFSWFFPRVILDVSNVLSSTIYSLPQLVNPDFVCYESLGKDGLIGGEGENEDTSCKFVTRVNLFPTMGECSKSPAPLPECYRPQNKEEGKRVGDFLDIFWTDWAEAANSGEYTGADMVINGLATNFAKLPNLGTIDFQELTLNAVNNEGIGDQFLAVFRFFIFLVLHIILALAIGLSLGAFAAVLIVRIAVLWLCIGFMPFIFVGYAFGKPLGDLSVGGESSPNLWQKFLNYAFLPTLVAIPYAIGFTLISNLYNYKALTLYLSVHGVNFLPGIHDFHQLLWLILTIAIIWFGTFMFLEKDQIAGQVAGWFKGIGTMGMKATRNLIGYAPIAPMPGGSLFGARNKLQQMGNYNPYLQMKRSRREGGGEPIAQDRIDHLTTQLSAKDMLTLGAILTATTKQTASDQLDEFSQQLSTLARNQEIDLSPQEARTIATNPESFHQFISNAQQRGLIDEQQANDFERQAELFRDLDAGQAPTVQSSMQFPVQSTWGEDEMKHRIAHDAAGYMDIDSISREDVVQALERRVQAVERGSAEYRALTSVIQSINRIDAKSTESDVANVLRNQYPTPPSSE